MQKEAHRAQAALNAKLESQRDQMLRRFDQEINVSAASLCTGFTILLKLMTCLWSTCVCQAKKKHYDTELENLEKHQKQTIEKMEENHAVKLKEETKRIKTEQERDHHKFQDQLKHRKKEVKQSVDKLPRSQRKDTLKQRMNTFQEKKMREVSLLCHSKQMNGSHLLKDVHHLFSTWLCCRRVSSWQIRRTT